MPLKLNVGLSKKLGLPDYGSLGASCHVELELDAALLSQDLAGFHERVRQAFTACSQAVKDELYRQQHGGEASFAKVGPSQPGDSPANGRMMATVANDAQTNGNSHGPGTPSAQRNCVTTSRASSNGRAAPRDTARRATSSQVRALETIAGRRRFLLADWLHERFGVTQAAELSLAQASQSIDELNGTLARKEGA
jgi:hypothetical protein